MTDKAQPDDGTVGESADVLVEPDADDPADLAGATAEETVHRQHDEVDQIAAAASSRGLVAVRHEESATAT